MVDVDKEVFNNLIKLHNDICFDRALESDFDKYVLLNTDLLDNPDFLQIFLERIDIDSDYYNAHYDLCMFIYNLILKYPDCFNLGFSFRTSMRIGLFEDNFKIYLENKSNL